MGNQLGYGLKSWVRNLSTVFLSVLLLSAPYQQADAFQEEIILEDELLECGETPICAVIMGDRTGSVSKTDRDAETTAINAMLDLLAAANAGHIVSVGRFGDSSNGGTEAEILSDLELQDVTANVTDMKADVTSMMSSRSSVGTNLEDVVEVARDELESGRCGDIETRVMILLTDGDPNENDTNNEDDNEGDDHISGNDNAARDAADEAKALDIDIITIAFDTSAAGTTDENNRKLLVDMASTKIPSDGTEVCGNDGCSAGEITAENTDGDKVFIATTGGEVAAVLAQIITDLECPAPGRCETGSCNESNECVYEPIEGCDDMCPDDPEKTEPGECGCGEADVDTDDDGTVDCNDACPQDSNKTEPGSCDCGVVDGDTDEDGVPDCSDACPDDDVKTEDEGECGCGVPDADQDEDGVPDCVDNCPEDANEDQADSDFDEVGDACEVEETEGAQAEGDETEGEITTGASRVGGGLTCQLVAGQAPAPLGGYGWLLFLLMPLMAFRIVRQRTS